MIANPSAFFGITPLHQCISMGQDAVQDSTIIGNQLDIDKCAPEIWL